MPSASSPEAPPGRQDGGSAWSAGFGVLAFSVLLPAPGQRGTNKQGEGFLVDHHVD